MVEQAESLVPWLARYQSAMVRVRVLPLVIAAVVAWQSWLAALILLLAAPLIPLFMAIVGWRAKAASEEQLVQLGSMNTFLLDRLHGLSTLRAFSAVEATAGQLDEQAQSLRQRTMRVLRIAFLSSAVLELFAALGVAMVAVYIGFHLLGVLRFGAWGHTLPLGSALFVLLLAPAFFEPLRDLSSVWHDRASGEAALEQLQGLQAKAQPLVGTVGMAEQGAKVPGVRQLQAAELAGARSPAMRVSARDLQVQVPGADLTAEASQRLQFDIAAGERVALWGHSGSGKSVLLAQLAGLCAVQQGTVEIDGQPLNGSTAASLRERMAWMGQQPHVFAGTAAHNIDLGQSATDAELQQAIAVAELDAVLQQRTAATLGEGGAGLSGGEGVRLALARLAWRSRHAGLLLVDEPTAHLDPATADKVIAALLQISQGRTLIVATHDERLVQALDRFIALGARGTPAVDKEVPAC